MLNTPCAYAINCEISQKDWVGRPIGWHYNIGLQEDDQRSLNALLQKQPSAGTQKKLRKNPIQTSGDTRQHTRSQRRRTPLPQTTILPQWLPELNRSEDSVETASSQYCCKTGHMASNFNIPDAVARLFKPHGIGVAHRPTGTLRSQLMRRSN